MDKKETKTASELIKELVGKMDELIVHVNLQNTVIAKQEQRIENLEELFERFAESIEEIQDFLGTYG